MAFNDFTQFPRGRKRIADLDSTPVTLFAANTSFKITTVVVTNTPGSSRNVTFRGVGSGATIMIVRISGGSFEIMPGWQTDAAGIEVLTDSATNDVDITAFTVEPTIS